MRNVFWGIILIAFGILFLLDNMEVVDFSDVIRTYWPALLVLWGISILLRKKGQPATHVFGDTQQKVSDELFHESSIFGDVFASVESQNFKGGSVSTVFGGNHIDLSNAIIADGEHWLRINGVFGDVHVVLPKNSACSVMGNVLFGGVQILDQRKSGFSTDVHYVSPGYETAQKKLRVSISQIFGSVSVSQ